MVEFVPVVSGNLAAAGWDDTTNTLYVKFKDGGEYAYSGVPNDIFQGLMQAQSKGKFFWKFIRDKYPTRKIK